MSISWQPICDLPDCIERAFVYDPVAVDHYVRGKNGEFVPVTAPWMGVARWPKDGVWEVEDSTPGGWEVRPTHFCLIEPPLT